MAEKLPPNQTAILIKPIKQNQIEDAKWVILNVGKEIYRWDESLEEIYQRFVELGEFSDMDDFQSYYSDRQGIFLVVTNQEQVIGTGAVRKITNVVCELKRLWLLEAYQGKGIGYRVMGELIGFARQNG